MKNQILSKNTTLTILVLFIFNAVSFAQYNGAKLNSDGSWSVGGAYDGVKLNSDGSWNVGWGKCKQ